MSFCEHLYGLKAFDVVVRGIASINRTLLVDSTGRYPSTFDAVGQTTITASPNNQRQTYSYDPVGQRRPLDAVGAGRLTYLYTAAGQLSSLLNPYGERSAFSYDDGGRRTVQRNEENPGAIHFSNVLVIRGSGFGCLPWCGGMLGANSRRAKLSLDNHRAAPDNHDNRVTINKTHQPHFMD